MTDVIIIIGLILAMINDFVLRREVRKYEELTKKSVLVVSEAVRLVNEALRDVRRERDKC